MARFRLSPAAEHDLETILAWTHEQFGERARLRYEALLVQAIIDVAADSERAGCQARPELAQCAFTYHLTFSRDHVNTGGRVRRPRHFLLCRTASDGTIEVGRVLHDSMDLARHLPAEYRGSDQEP